MQVRNINMYIRLLLTRARSLQPTMSSTSQVEYKFFVKASPDGKSLGDCPFTQRANLAFKIKKVPVTYIIIDLAHKPQWFLDLFPTTKSTPAIQYGNDGLIGDSYEIVQYLDKTYPSPSLKPAGNEKAETVTGNIFNVFSSWAKHSKEMEKRDELEGAFTAELKKIDDFLAESGGPLLCGSTWSVADCALVPRLYHIETVAEHFLHYNKMSTFKHVKQYMDHTFSTQEFKDTNYPREWILTGWVKYFQ